MRTHIRYNLYESELNSSRASDVSLVFRKNARGLHDSSDKDPGRQLEVEDTEALFRFTSLESSKGFQSDHQKHYANKSIRRINNE